MFFNSLDRTLKKMYRSLNPQLKDYVFPRGEKEFMYVGTMLDLKIPGKELVKLIQIYASVYTYYGSTSGNAHDTYRYAKKKTLGFLTDDQTLTLLGIVSVSTVASRVKIADPVAAVDEYKGYAKDYINKVDAIAAHPDVFETKKGGVGKQENPILVAGVQGVREYIESLDCSAYTFGLTSVKFSKTSTVHLTHSATGISYAIDEYTLWLEAGGTEIQKLWFNIYGTANCPLSPAGLKFIAGSQMAKIEQQHLETEAAAEKAKKEAEKEKAAYENKAVFSTDTLGSYLMSKTLEAVNAVREKCNQNGVSYLQEKLFVATSAYCYVLWMVSFKNITLRKSFEIEEKYRREIVNLFKALHSTSKLEVMRDEKAYKAYLWDVNVKIRTPYEENGMILSDYGITDAFIMEFISHPEELQVIKEEMALLLFDGWVKEAKQLAESAYIE